MVDEFEFFTIMEYVVTVVTTIAVVVSMRRDFPRLSTAPRDSWRFRFQRRKSRRLPEGDEGGKASAISSAMSSKPPGGQRAVPPSDYSLERVARLAGISVASLKTWLAERREEVREEEARKVLLQLLADLEIASEERKSWNSRQGA